jgi:hypothetical protein
MAGNNRSTSKIRETVTRLRVQAMRLWARGQLNSASELMEKAAKLEDEAFRSAGVTLDRPDDAEE